MFGYWSSLVNSLVSEHRITHLSPLEDVSVVVFLILFWFFTLNRKFAIEFGLFSSSKASFVASGLTLSHLSYVCMAFSPWQRLTKSYITKNTVLRIGRVEDWCPWAPGPSHPTCWRMVLTASHRPAAKHPFSSSGKQQRQTLPVVTRQNCWHSIRRDLPLFLQGFWKPLILPPNNCLGTLHAVCHAQQPGLSSWYFSPALLRLKKNTEHMQNPILHTYNSKALNLFPYQYFKEENSNPRGSMSL